MYRDGPAESRREAEEKRPFLDVVGRHQEKEFDELAELAAAVCWTPVSQVKLLDEQFEYRKGAVGLQDEFSESESSLCRETLQRDGEILIVRDVATDPQFARSPFATGQTALRFYAGVRLYSPGGEKVGVLCVADTISRELKPWQVRSLRLVAHQVNARLELILLRRMGE